MRTIGDEKLASAIGRKLIGSPAGYEKVEQLREIARRSSSALVRIEEVGAVVSEVDALRESVSILAAEVRAFRANVQLERDAPPPSADVCRVCRKFRPLLSVYANQPPVNQALLKTPGACCAGRPVLNKDGAGDKAVLTSAFIPVDGDQWCDEFERRDPEAGGPA